MGQSFVSKVAPPRIAGLMMGGWFAATAAGSYGSGLLGKSYSRLAHHEFFLILAGLMIAGRRPGRALSQEAEALRQLITGGRRMTLIQEKVEQAAAPAQASSASTAGSPSPARARSAATRRSSSSPRGPSPGTRPSSSAADGRTRAIVGLYDQKGIEETGRLRQGRRLRHRHQGAAPRVPEGARSPDDRRQLLRGERDLRRPDPRHVPDAPASSWPRPGWPNASSRPRGSSRPCASASPPPRSAG